MFHHPGALPPPAQGRGQPQAPPEAEPRPGAAGRPNGLRCPHCDSVQVRSHGSFPLRDGSRQPRYLCQTCGRTFNRLTGTPLAYLKKRHLWLDMARCMLASLPVRQTAAELGVRPATAFAWRHRLLAAASSRRQPVLSGSVMACEAWIPYSEKGNWYSKGPGSRSGELTYLARRPSCVLLVSTGPRAAAAVIVSQGQPAPGQLALGLATVLQPATDVLFSGLAPYAEACQLLRVPHRNLRSLDHSVRLNVFEPCVGRARSTLYYWLKWFRRVATRYLSHYLWWYLFLYYPPVRPRGARDMLAAADATWPWRQAA